MIWDALAIFGILCIFGICSLIIWAAYELRKLARAMGWTIDA